MPDCSCDQPHQKEGEKRLVLCWVGENETSNILPELPGLFSDTSVRLTEGKSATKLFFLRGGVMLYFFMLSGKQHYFFLIILRKFLLLFNIIIII